MRLVLTGLGASRGMALGRARLEQPSRYLVDDRPLAEAEVDAEVERLRQAIAAAREELALLREKVHGAMAREVAEFIDAHSLMLADRELTSGLFDLIRIGRYRASAALKMQKDRLVAVFEAMDDPYLRSRKEDVEHVIARVQAGLSRESSRAERQLASRVGEILISDSVAPSELVPLAEHGVLGVVLTSGSQVSHSAILARSLRLPMIVAAHDALARIQDDDLILVDGDRGEAIVHPAAPDLARYRAWQREMAQKGKRLALLRDAETRTLDGVPIALHANAESAADIAQARACGAAGIGLYRTEFLFLQRREVPDEDEQFLCYRDLVLGMGGLPVTIRTLDLGADKADSSGLVLDDEENPALGVRGVRLSLRHPQLMRTQLRAILRASAYGPVRVLVPMVSAAEEMASVRHLLRDCARDLRSAGHEIAENVELGAMIEVPAAAIALQGMIRSLDFVAIGTNDLVQYTLAVDRNNDQLANLYDPLHPAVLKLLAQTIACARRAGKRVTLCGEMAGDRRYTALLLALGLTDFSMHPAVLLEIREAIIGLDCAAARAQAKALLRAPTRERIGRVLARMGTTP
ncbi:phosphoenolpyruvate--protein phosphotransferase [Dokdonella fugitiva]|uniref:Phosphoenolpyruvate-protein phosphotransferase n=1 Tax=Dokdonella fugitiva TaxID=328517 RepID=A0A4R2ID06_9GAMM|nr:phosphoenolpyruvate--protein phosphotransferase [Dokdonella fugitiva]MBA8885069.1 phosphotransferase system enzyme I (PtsI) [Dokdonella fugitiva]TCO42167.1 phosphotransferase system enzyme I (PtsI) [Dokdonella fugitiva]